MTGHEPLEYRESGREEPDLDAGCVADQSYDDLSRMWDRLSDEYLRWRWENLLDRAYPAFVDEIVHDYGGPRETSPGREDADWGRP